MRSNAKKNNNYKLLGIMFFCIVFIVSIPLVVGLSRADYSYVENNINTYQYFNNKSIGSLYLSDIDYIKNQSFVGWDQIRYDEVNSGGKIAIKIENSIFEFDKGIWAHANSQVTYDISEYDYKYFTAFVGLNNTTNRGDGVKFSIYTSEDGNDWGEAKYEAIKIPGESATFVKIDISNANYLRLVANQRSSNASDHSVYADAKLVYEVDESSFFKSVDEYNEIIKNMYKGETNITGELEFNLLKRELVKKVGQYTINSFYNANEDNKAAIDWLMNNQDIIRYYILGGTPDGGSYYKSLTELSRLYKTYKNDFTNKEATNNMWYPDMTKGDVYTRMAISLALTHSTAVGYWAQIDHPSNRSDSLERYSIYKYLYDNGMFKVSDRQDQTPWFEALNVEEMRYVMNNILDNEELIWLNEYTQRRIDAHPNEEEKYLQPHTYIAYVWPDYNNPIFHDPANYEYFDELFEGIFSKYGVTYSKEGDMVKKAWMTMRNKWGTGAVCGGISKLGTHIRAAHGMPASVISQPGHAAIIFYRKDANGKGYWTMDNDVSGWAQSGKSEKMGTRMPLGWGSDSYVSGWAATYMMLGQEAMNDWENYQNSEKLIMLADVYSNDKAQREGLLRKALEVLPINIDAWWEIIKIYNADSTKTEEDYYKLMVEMSAELLPFPLPLYNLMGQLKSKFVSTEYEFKFTLLQDKILNAEKNYNGDKVYQPNITRTVGAYLLGQTDTSLATFSFDGENSEEIVLSNRFDGNGIRWDYSLDGKKTWKEVNFSADDEHKLKLTSEEIRSITAENDIYVHIVGANYNEENLYKIDIQESLGLPNNLYANDLEDKVIAAVPTMMWKYKETDEWTYFKDAEPDLTGDKAVIVRAGATGLYLPSKNSFTYHFTNNVQPKNRQYIYISHLGIHKVSSEATGQGRHAYNIIDGNIHTSWHSAWDGSDRTKEIIIKLDEIKNLTALDYYPLAGGNGKIEKAKIYVSVDGEKYMEVAETDWTYENANDAAVRTIDFEPARAQYIKIVGVKTQASSSSMSFIAGAMFNFYEDTTVKIVADFSFDGETAGEINLIDSEYKEVWNYSLDGGKTWKLATGNKHQLNKTELSELNAENGIKIKLENDDTEYSIKIKEAGLFTINPYVNDLENRLIGLKDVSKLEWKYSNTEEWTSYNEEEPVVKGDNTLQVRVKATGNTLPSNILEFEFTDDNQTKEMKYIPIKHLTIHGYSTQSIDSNRPFYAPNAIDGNPNTLWHTDFRYSVLNDDKKPYISIKLDSPRKISAFEFIQTKYKHNDPDDIKNGIVYVSMDGENWTEAGRIENCPHDNKLRQIVFEESVLGQYVKLEMETYNMFASVAMINIYEDVSQLSSHVTIQYDVTNKTNKSVTAELVSDKEIEIMNNGGSNKFVFDENGIFTFEYKDKTGEIKTIIASVNWIDKKAPIGTIDYSIMHVTNKNVVVTLKTDEKVTITNNNGSNKYTFTENGEFTFEFVDEAGNSGTAAANVTWINKKAPVGTITYSTNSPTNKEVVATLNVEDGVTVINNDSLKIYTFDKNGEFTFEFVDEVGNRGTTTAIVNWIDKVAPTAKVEYSETNLTNKNVTATLKNFSEEVTILNNGGKNSYVFTQNGSFVFEFVDKAGNKTTMTANVNWINKDNNQNIDTNIDSNNSNNNSSGSEIDKPNDNNQNNSGANNNTEPEDKPSIEDNESNNEDKNELEIKTENDTKNSMFRIILILLFIFIIIILGKVYFNRKSNNQ